MIKFGFVTESKPGFCRVELTEDEILSGWLPVVQQFTRDNQANFTQDVGAHVACMFDEFTERGVVLGAMYSERDTVPADLDDPDIAGTVFSDGTKVTHNRATGVTVVDSSGKVTVTAATEVSATVGASEFKATAAGVTVKGAGVSLKDLINDILVASMAQTHISAAPGAPTGPPINIASYIAAQVKLNLILEA